MNKQRKEVYAFRQEILETEDLFAAVFDLFQQFSVTLVDKFCVGEDPDLWQADEMTHELMSCLPITFTQEELDPYQHSVKELHTLIFKKIKETFQKKMTYEQQKISEHHDLIQKLADRELIDRDRNRSMDAALHQILLSLFLSHIDRHWQNHLLQVDHLRTEVGLRSIGQKDPLMEFKHESFLLFDRFIQKVRLEIAKALFQFEITLPNIEEIKNRLEQAHMQQEQQQQAKINRNALCTCGSGKKYKKCCGAKEKTNV